MGQVEELKVRIFDLSRTMQVLERRIQESPDAVALREARAEAQKINSEILQLEKAEKDN